MTKINELEDLKRYVGDIALDRNKLYDLIKEHVAPENQAEFVNLVNYSEQDLARRAFATGRTYALALDDLFKNASIDQPSVELELGKKLYRPLTLKETMLERLEHRYLYEKSLETCSGIFSKNDKGELYKVVSVAKELLVIPKDFGQSEYIDVFHVVKSDYDSFEGEEFNVKTTNSRDIWLLAMGGFTPENRALYKEYKELVMQHCYRETPLKFYTPGWVYDGSISPLSLYSFTLGSSLHSGFPVGDARFICK